MMRSRLRFLASGAALLLAAGTAFAQSADDPQPLPSAAAAAAAAVGASPGKPAPAAAVQPPKPKVVRIPMPPRRPAGLEALAGSDGGAGQLGDAPQSAGADPASQRAIPAVDVETGGVTPARVQPAAAVATSPAAILDRVNASLNAMNVLQADFVQTGANGRRSEGRLYVVKPGRLRFEYDPPNPVEIVADGSKVAIRDRKLNTQDIYPIGQTPLKFLLKENVDIARDTKVVDVENGKDLVGVTIEDKSTFGGTSRVELRFDPRSYALKQWTVTDPQGYQTTVNLKNASATKPDDPFIFSIDYTRMMGGK
jgi:outer membrane lipoprotein-sorting protein